MLREEPGVLLQQTTSAQISPIIRGLTGPSTVYLVDGVRLNTGQWRFGSSQYVSFIDGGPVDAIEVVRGGGSVQYGSDALGGTVTTPPIAGAHARRLRQPRILRGSSLAPRSRPRGGRCVTMKASRLRS